MASKDDQTSRERSGVYEEKMETCRAGGSIDGVSGDLGDVSAALDAADAHREDVEFDGSLKDGVIGVKLLNYKAPILPHTGGIGAAVVLTVSSLVLLFGAFALVIAFRKKKAQ